MAEIEQLDLPAGRLARIVGQQHLPPVGDAHHPRGAMNVNTPVVAVPDPWRSRVQSHPDPRTDAVRPGVLDQPALRDPRGLHRVPGVRERYEERVAVGPHLDPIVSAPNL